MDNISGQVNGVKKLGYTILVTILFATMSFTLMGYAWFKIVSFAEISGHLTMTITYMFSVACAYLGIQGAADVFKKKEDTKPMGVK